MDVLVLGSLLLLVYINDLPNKQPENKIFTLTTRVSRSSATL